METLKLLLRNCFSEQVRTVRKNRRLTQEEMAEQLRITTRAYSDLERGRSCCSATVLLCFLLILESDELSAFLGQMRKQIYEQEQAEIA